MSQATADVRPPSRLLMMAESRAFWETGASVAMWPWLNLAPAGDGHPVLVLPGLGASDSSTRLLRRYLAERGYDVHGWGQGRNFGPRSGVEDSMVRRLYKLSDEHGRRVSLVGWSLGGVYARLLASRHAERVRGVISLGSPLRGDVRATNAWRFYEMVSGRRAGGASDPARRARVLPTPPVPSTSIYSRTDGVVAWQCSLAEPGPQTENIEVLASHMGMGSHPAVLYAVADRLAQAEGQWKPFSGQLMGPLVYPKPARP